MTGNRLLKNLIDEYRHIYTVLYKEELIIEHREISQKCTGNNRYELTWTGRNSKANITFNIGENIDVIMNSLLENEQFSILFYDKSLLQVEYIIEEDEIIKQRLQYIKKSNIVRTVDEIRDLEIGVTEVEAGDWFEDELGIPIFLRADYEPDKHEEVYHSKSHFVISNLKNCRIPMKKNLSLTKFVTLILQQIYNRYDIVFMNSVDYPDVITKKERENIYLSC